LTAEIGKSGHSTRYHALAGMRSIAATCNKRRNCSDGEATY